MAGSSNGSLGELEAERQPGTTWQVYFGPPHKEGSSENNPYYVGAMALFGQGIRAEAHDKFEPAHFAFPINRAIAANLRAKEGGWAITFVPAGILINGKPSQPKVQSPVRVGSVAISVETQRPGNEKGSEQPH